jgi:hypothetical protein
LAPEVLEAVTQGLTGVNPAFAAAIESGSQGEGIDQAQLNLEDWPTISFILRGPNGEQVKLSCAPSTYWQFDVGSAGHAVFLIGNSGMALSILGLPLFNNYYTVFNRSEDGTGVIRFATIKPPTP